MTDYCLDEALRIVNVTAMFEGHTYEFDVRNTAGSFMVMMTGHRYAEQQTLPCNRIEDPSAMVSKNLKDAIHLSVQDHLKRRHAMRVV